MNDDIQRVIERLQPFFRLWRDYESAPRKTCPICWFESTEGRPESHAPGCRGAEREALPPPEQP